MESARIDCAVRGRDFKSVLEAIAKRGESGCWREVVVAGDSEIVDEVVVDGPGKSKVTLGGL